MYRLSETAPKGTTTLPEIRRQTGGEFDQALSLHIPTTLRFFQGHFEKNPIVPGYVLFGWALHYARDLWPDLNDSSYSCSAIKFTEPVLPNEFVLLHLGLTVADRKLKFVYIPEGKDLPCCSGQVRFRNATSHPVDQN